MISEMLKLIQLGQTLGPGFVWPESLLTLKSALFSLSLRTPFAWLAALGAALAALGAITVLLAGRTIEARQKYDSRRDRIDSAFGTPLRPGEPGFRAWIATIGWFENGYYVFLAGVLLIVIGICPFVTAPQP